MPDQATAPILAASDWINSRPVFYDERTGRTSHQVNDLIDFAALEFDAEGLWYYLYLGFAAFGHTPVAGVRFLPAASRLVRGGDGRPAVEHLPDPAELWRGRRSTEAEVLELLRERLRDIEQRNRGALVVPTSGGYDSRLINLLLSERSRVRAFTYGTSDDQSRSVEVVKAKRLAELLGIQWEAVPIGDFLGLIGEWDASFGPSCHAHGMYQLEFYRQVVARVGAGHAVISGCGGDWLAGADVSWAQAAVARPEDTLRVFGFSADDSPRLDPKASRLPCKLEALEEYWTQNPQLRGDPVEREMECFRARMMWLDYLRALPECVGLRVEAPYLDPEIGLRMLHLAPDRRRDRLWQTEIFRKAGVDLDGMSLGGDRMVTLNYQAMRRVPLRPLDAGLLGEIIEPSVVRRINRDVGPFGRLWEALWRLEWKPGLRTVMSRVARTGLPERRMAALEQYVILKPLELLLRKRDAARAGEPPDSVYVGGM